MSPSEEQSNFHIHADGTVHYHAHNAASHDHELSEGIDEHDHAHVHDHSHGHTHTQTKAVINRLSRAIGHLESIRRMVEDGRDCTEVLIQLAAVRSALNSTAKVILKDHMEHCVGDSEHSEESLAALNEAIDKFL